MPAAPEPLTREQRIRLLRIARDSVFHWVNRSKIPTFEEQDERLCLKQGVFVSLHIGDRLRGCIGTFESDKPLFQTVAEMAVGAASRDPRFSPMRLDEVPRTEFELSILGPLEVVAAEDVVPGEHGLLISLGRRRGTLLPQVATQHGWDRDEFLTQTCVKAGLEGGDWRQADAHIEAFTAEVFCESDMRAQ